MASDHGEAFGEHDKDGHAYDVYGEVTEVPFLISFPFRLEKGIVVDSPSENVDIWPTLLETHRAVAARRSRWHIAPACGRKPQR